MHNVYLEMEIPIDLLVLLLCAHSLLLEQLYTLPCHCATYFSVKHSSQIDNYDDVP